MDVGVCTVQRVFSTITKCTGNISNRGKLETHHVTAQLESEKMMSFFDVRDWKTTVFTDEKSVSLDCSGSLGYFWGKKSLEILEFSMR